MAFSASANASSDYLTGRQQAVSTMDNTLVSQRFPITLTTADLGAAVVGAVGLLPAGCVPVAVEVDAAQLDSNGTPTLAYSIGLLNAAQSAIDTSASAGGAAWVTGQTTGRTAGGSASGPIASRPLKLTQQAQADRYVGIAITGAAATAVAGQLALTLWYRPGPG